MYVMFIRANVSVAEVSIQKSRNIEAETPEDKQNRENEAMETNYTVDVTGVVTDVTADATSAPDASTSGIEEVTADTSKATPGAIDTAADLSVTPVTSKADIATCKTDDDPATGDVEPMVTGTSSLSSGIEPQGVTEAETTDDATPAADEPPKVQADIAEPVNTREPDDELMTTDAVESSLDSDKPVESQPVSGSEPLNKHAAGETLTSTTDHAYCNINVATGLSIERRDESRDDAGAGPSTKGSDESRDDAGAGPSTKGSDESRDDAGAGPSAERRDELSAGTSRELPFQLQIEYTDLDGAKALRVITQTKPVTKQRDQAEKGKLLEYQPALLIFCCSLNV